MKRVRGLFERLTDRDWFERCVDDAIRGKRSRSGVARMLLQRESIERELLAGLGSGRFRPAPMRALTLRDPKPRVIAWSPLQDRLVFHALARLLELAFLPAASESHFACLPGRGVHRARLRLGRHLARSRWYLHLDLRSHFPSIDLDRLRDLLDRKIADRPFLETLDRVLRAGAGFADPPHLRRFARMDLDWPPRGRGLPIGLATSQTLAALVYLAELDHWIQRIQRPAGYLRYVDALFLFDRDRRRLEELRAEIGDWLEERRDLRLKSALARVRSSHGALDGLGARITRSGISPLPRRVADLRSAARRELWGGVFGEPKVGFQAGLPSRVGEIFRP